LAKNDIISWAKANEKSTSSFSVSALLCFSYSHQIFTFYFDVEIIDLIHESVMSLKIQQHGTTKRKGCCSEVLIGSL